MITKNRFRGIERSGSRVFCEHTAFLRSAAAFSFFLIVMVAGMPAHGRDKKVLQYGAGLIVNIPLPEPEVEQVIVDIAQNTIIRGTKEYNKDEYVAGAVAATSTTAFARWTQGGKVLYKVREHALDPRNFKDSSDVGTLAVRYVVQPQGESNTVLRIDAVFVEDFRRVSHPSDGSVESAEYKDIQDRLHAVEQMKQETAEALRAKEERAAKQHPASVNSAPAGESSSLSGASEDADNEWPRASETTSAPQESAGQELPTQPATAEPAPVPSSETSRAYELTGDALEKHIADLRRQVVRLVKKPGAPLQSAPFHTATKLKSLEPGTEILVVITTPYWLGVETHDGDHGWVRRDELELAP
ncbi:MAG: hypothetical protein ABSG02_16915 [Terriglobales bacterium]